MHFRVEKLADLGPELHALTQAHWDEVEAPMYGTQKLILDRKKYALLEELGMLCIVTARDADGTLAGYAAYSLVDCPHIKGRTLAALDGLYLAPPHRQGWTALRLLCTAEHALCQGRAHMVQYSSPASRPCNALYRRLGAVHTESIWHKELVPAPAAPAGTVRHG